MAKLIPLLLSWFLLPAFFIFPTAGTLLPRELCGSACSRAFDTFNTCAGQQDADCLCSTNIYFQSDLADCIRCYDPYNRTMAHKLGQYEKLCGTSGEDACAAECAVTRRGITACSIQDSFDNDCACSWSKNKWDIYINECLDCLEEADTGLYSSWQMLSGICGGDAHTVSKDRTEPSSTTTVDTSTTDSSGYAGSTTDESSVITNTATTTSTDINSLNSGGSDVSEDKAMLQTAGAKIPLVLGFIFVLGFS